MSENKASDDNQNKNNFFQSVGKGISAVGNAARDTWFGRTLVKFAVFNAIFLSAAFYGKEKLFGIIEDRHEENFKNTIEQTFSDNNTVFHTENAKALIKNIQGTLQTDTLTENERDSLEITKDYNYLLISLHSKDSKDIDSTFFQESLGDITRKSREYSVGESYITEDDSTARILFGGHYTDLLESVWNTTKEGLSKEKEAALDLFEEAKDILKGQDQKQDSIVFQLKPKLQND